MKPDFRNFGFVFWFRISVFGFGCGFYEIGPGIIMSEILVMNDTVNIMKQEFHSYPITYANSINFILRKSTHSSYSNFRES